MSETTTAVTPDAADRKPRTAAAPKPPVTDPEAPFGWMKDPVTGKTRPRKRPGRQNRTEAPPRERAANQARSSSPPKTPGASAKHAKAVSSLTEGIWMLLAAVPQADVNIPLTKVSVRDISVRTRAQAEILSDNADSFTRSIVMMADHSSPVSRFLLKADSDNSPIWVIPCMMGLLPFVVQSGAMWNSPPAGGVAELAERTTLKLDVLIHSMTVPEGSPNGDHASGSAPVPGAEPHPHP